MMFQKPRTWRTQFLSDVIANPAVIPRNAAVNAYCWSSNVVITELGLRDSPVWVLLGFVILGIYR